MFLASIDGVGFSTWPHNFNGLSTPGYKVAEDSNKVARNGNIVAQNGNKLKRQMNTLARSLRMRCDCVELLHCNLRTNFTTSTL